MSAQAEKLASWRRALMDAERECTELAVRVDALTAALRDARTFVSTGGPLHTKDRLQLIEMLNEGLAGRADTEEGDVRPPVPESSGR